MNKRLWLLVVITTVFSVGHHLDHIIRGNHVGWPVSGVVTPFTWSLGFYPVILLGILLSRRGTAGPGYWAVLTAAGFLFVGLAHFGPVAVEPPADILAPYRSAAAGWLAIGWLIAFLALLLASCMYSARRWLALRRTGPAVP
jgi:hypothetical protein